ncbi:hypothetical protein [Actinoallomurus sp. NPDC050550]|uniref:hypothetical protein n=1 Tax=Actinoallomurus sp. NPDC050550 TaxID=3154937 RepID=UPI0033C1CF7C
MESINALLDVVRDDAGTAPWAVAEVMVAMARRLVPDDRATALALLTEARTLDLGEGVRKPRDRPSTAVGRI